MSSRLQHKPSAYIDKHGSIKRADDGIVPHHQGPGGEIAAQAES